MRKIVHHVHAIFSRFDSGLARFAPLFDCLHKVLIGLVLNRKELRIHLPEVSKLVDKALNVVAQDIGSVVLMLFNLEYILIRALAMLVADIDASALFFYLELSVEGVDHFIDSLPAIEGELVLDCLHCLGHFVFEGFNDQLMWIVSLLQNLIGLDSFRMAKFSEDFKQAHRYLSLQAQVLTTEIETLSGLSHLCPFANDIWRVLLLENFLDLLIDVQFVDGRNTKLRHPNRTLAFNQQIA